MNILITSASRKVSLIRAFQKALGEEGGGQVIAVDCSPLAASLRIADQGYVIPIGVGDNFRKAIGEICNRHHVDLIVPTRDEEIPFFASSLYRWKAIGIKVMVSDPSAVEACQDKKQFLEFCKHYGFDFPPTFQPDEIRAVDYPLFVKERFGKGSRGSFSVESPEDLAYSLRRTKKPIIQKLIRAPEYTVDLFADFDGRILSVVPRERISTVAGESYLGRTCKKWSVINAAVRLAEELRLKGHNTMQCFDDEGIIRWIEVNPRYGGAANLGFAAGANTPRLLVRLLKGESIPPMIGNFIDGLVMLRYSEDLFVSTEALQEIPRVS